MPGKVHELGGTELSAATAQQEIKAMHSQNHDIPPCRWGLCLAGGLSAMKTLGETVI